jgi:hypothetical protein
MTNLHTLRDLGVLDARMTRFMSYRFATVSAAGALNVIFAPAPGK